MSEELKPCPICGGTSDEDDYNDMADPESLHEDPPVCFSVQEGMEAAGCGSCELWVMADTKEEAAEIWNTRPIEAALREQLKQSEERVAELEGGMREIMVSVGRVEPKDGHPEFGYIYSVAKALLKGE